MTQNGIYNYLLSCYTPSTNRKGGKLMDRDSFETSLLEEGFSEEEAAMIAQDFDKEFGDDPDFQD